MYPCWILTMKLFLCWSLISVFSLGLSGQLFEGIRGPFDVCERDVFNATCPPGHVILMQDALYGRMTPGRCVPNDASNGSCDSDVMGIMDALCSGRESCQVLGIHPDLVYSKKCEDSAAYLRASYQCIKVTLPTTVSCNNTAIEFDLENEGHIPLSILADLQIATDQCPLVIPESKAKIFNFTLLSFHDNDAKLSGDACFEVGMLREKKRETPIVSCQGDPREKSLFTSSRGPLFLYFYDVKGQNKIATFLLQYQASFVASAACDDPVLPSQASFTLSDNEVSVTCDVTDATWRLRCVEGEWKGEVGQCGSFEENNAAMTALDSQVAFSLGLLAVLSLGVAIVLFLGGFFFYVLCFSCKRLKRGSMDQYMKRDQVSFLYPYHTKLSNSESDPRSDYSRAPLYRQVTSEDSLSDHNYMLYDRDYRPITPAASPQSTRAVPSSTYMPLSPPLSPV